MNESQIVNRYKVAASKAEEMDLIVEPSFNHFTIRSNDYEMYVTVESISDIESYLMGVKEGRQRAVIEAGRVKDEDLI